MSSEASSSIEVAALQSAEVKKKIFFWIPDWPEEEAHPRDDELDIEILAVSGNKLPSIPAPRDPRLAGSIVVVGCCKNTLCNMQAAVVDKNLKSPGYFNKMKFVHTNQNCAVDKCRETANTGRFSQVWTAREKNGWILEVKEKTSKEVVEICVDGIKNDFDAFFANYFAFATEQNNEREVDEERKDAFEEKTPESEENAEIEEAKPRLRPREGHVVDDDDTNGSPPMKMSHNDAFNPTAMPLHNLTKAVQSSGSGVLSPIRTNSPVTPAANSSRSSPGCNRSSFVGSDKEFVPERIGRPSDSSNEVVDKTEQENVFNFPEERNNEDDNNASEPDGSTAAL